MVENMYSVSSYFVTLTYDTPHLPVPIGVNKSDLQKFFKRLRHDVSFRYFLVSEYGGIHGRPHYHLLLFFDKELGIIQLSRLLEKSWPLGKHCIGLVDISSISYCAKYCLKPKKDPTGLYFAKTFALMSRRPAIGYRFLEEDVSQYVDNDIFEFSCFGRVFNMPRYYRDKLFDDDQKASHRLKMQEKYNDYNKDLLDNDERYYKRLAFEQKQKDM